MKLTLYKPKTNITKTIPEGFSWTTFFFGILVMISRSMWPQALISFFTFGLANFYYIFTLNRIYRDKLLEEGWVIHHDDGHFLGV
jgi:hypothetical protein